MKDSKILSNVYIYKIGYGGVGIGSLPDGKKVLVKGGALPQSTVDIKIVKKKKDYIEGHIIHTHKYNKDLADGEVFCPHYFIPIGASQENQSSYKIGCGGCKRQIVSYENQLKLKYEIVKDGFEKIKKQIPELEILPIIGSPLQKGYRNKIEFSFGVYISEKENLESRWNLGFHKQGEFSKIVDIASCGLISQKANEIFNHIKELCYNSGLPVFDQKTHQGFFRHLVIREGINTDQILVNLSVFEDSLKKTYNDKRNEFLEIIQKDEFLKNNITTLVITYNNGLADTVKSDKSESKTLRGDGYIYENLNIIHENHQTSAQGNAESSQSNLQPLNQENVGSSTFRISPFSFFQTNTLGAQKLFSQAQQMLGYVKGTILDLYCGTGTIGISLLKSGVGSNLVGIEIVQDAITDAKHNAKINGLEDKCFFLASPSEKAFNLNPDLKEKIKNLGAVILDPPRDGLHKNLINFLGELKKEFDFKILYISCNPITMARDIQLFIENGFKINKLQPVDMFPQTHHIEVIGILY